MDGVIFVDFDGGRWKNTLWIVGDLCHIINARTSDPDGVLVVVRDGEKFSSEGLGWVGC